ncbi:MAG: DUF2242 domain-containing protein [Comamonadaceae bacterium]|nr:MAG: DUF2242 domain-containing protein [Comamonadaceae bacterium]
MPLPSAFRCSSALSVALLLPVLLLAACTTGTSTSRQYATESFDSTTTHARNFTSTEAQTCEAARRALLSQGYFVTRAGDDQVAGRKQFQPLGDVHVDVDFRVVCVRDERQGRGSIAFATAVQDRYELKKASSSASVGVGAIGSLSLPFNASNDAMVKVASQTVTQDEFYARFFVLLDEYLYVPETPAVVPAAQAMPGQSAPIAVPRVVPVPVAPLAPTVPDEVPVPPSATRG